MKLTDLKQALKDLGLEYSKIKDLPAEERKAFGQEINRRKNEILAQIQAEEEKLAAVDIKPIDLTAPMAENSTPKKIRRGTKHPLMVELDKVIDIYSNMGFEIMESTQLDDEFHMFESLNFPEGHPARDGYDTFRTKEGFIPPAHTSTMQYRALTSRRDQRLS